MRLFEVIATQPQGARLLESISMLEQKKLHAAARGLLAKPTPRDDCVSKQRASQSMILGVCMQQKIGQCRQNLELSKSETPMFHAPKRFAALLLLEADQMQRSASFGSLSLDASEPSRSTDKSEQSSAALVTGY